MANHKPHSPALLHLYPAVFLISAVGIAYQIVLMRVFSIAQWHHFAYMIISVAMLGIGAGGAVMTFCRERVVGHESGVFYYLLVGLAVSLPVCYVLALKVPFEMFHLVSAPSQLGWLLLLTGILVFPFFLSSLCLTLAFFVKSDRVGRVYFVDLMGSGVGAACVVGMLFFLPPTSLPYVLSLPLLVVAGGQVRHRSLPDKWVFGTLGIGLGLWFGMAGFSPVPMSSYKALSYALQFPDAEVTATAQSPLSQINLVRSSHIRETPGQLGNYPYAERGGLPEQAGLFFDGGAVSVVNAFDGDWDGLSYLDYVTPALPYKLVEEPTVLVIGAGGGTDVLMALYHGARHVTAVEVDPSVFSLIERELAGFSGGLYQREDVEPVVAEGRGFLKGRDKHYDVIQIALLDAFSAAASGVYALSESYLYTKEAVSQYLRHLTEDGVLAVTRWLKTPPRDAVKMMATMIEACEAVGIEEPGAHLAFIRSWNAATVLVSRSPWTDAQLAAMRSFSVSRGFDRDWHPGLAREEVNRFTIMEEPIYYDAALALLSTNRPAFYDRYLFDVRPATDDRPYFFQFFKGDTLQWLVQDMGIEWGRFVEWGYVALLGTIVQGSVASALMILLPLLVLARRTETRGARRWVVGYFMVLGLGFMFLEIAFIQKFMLFLAYPVYAVAVVLTAFLTCSGLGSFCADRWSGDRFRLLALAVSGIVGLTVLYTAMLPLLFDAWAGWSDPARIAVSFLLIAPLAFCMGIPFPTGFQLVSNQYPAMLPWAWAINGVASVMGASLATWTAIHWGFRTLVWTAALIYLIGLPCLYRMEKGARHAA